MPLEHGDTGNGIPGTGHGTWNTVYVTRDTEGITFAMLVKRQVPQLAISNQQSARSLAAGAARLIEQETFVFFLAFRTRNPVDPVILSKTFHTSGQLGL